MKQSKQVSARITTDSINNYVEKYKEFEKQVFPEARPEDLKMTRILEDALFYAAKYFDQVMEEGKNTNEKLS